MRWKLAVVMMVLLSVTCVAAEKKEVKKEEPKPCQKCVQLERKIKSLETQVAQLNQHIAQEKQKTELTRKLMVRALAINDQ